MNDYIFSRRGLLISASALALSSCVTCGEELPDLPTDTSKWISDAHTHFFNASDLPVAGYVKFVVLRNYFKDIPEIALAIVDIFINLIKPFAVSIKRERKHNLKSRLESNFYEGITAKDYANRFKNTVDSQYKKSSKSSNPGVDLQASYLALASILKGIETDDQVRPSGSPNRFTFLQALEVNEELIEAIIENDSEKLSSEFNVINNNQGEYGFIPSPRDAENQNSKSGIQNLIGLIRWSYLMMKSRCFHINTYVNKLSTMDYKPSVVINLLVDYDKWLNDGPSDNSSHIHQIEFWHEYSHGIRDKLDIRTFAGYDPLHHAYEKSYYESLKQSYEDGKLSGFKLYPPMGFQVFSNENLKFYADDGIKKSVINKWGEEFPGKSLGHSLDTSLDEFFTFCTGNNALKSIVPILAHAGNSNAPARGFGERANPKYWHERITKNNLSNLRLCLGHFTHAPEFIEGMKQIENGGKTPDLWALNHTKDLISLSVKGRADVYADIGYMVELIPADGSESSLAVEFFKYLLKYCKWTGDHKCMRLMYGSDWIMLGLEHNHENYLPTILNALDEASWEPEMKQNFLTNNLRRFIGLGPI